MIKPSRTVLASLTLIGTLMGTLALSGCSGFGDASFPSSAAVPSSTASSVGSISGSNYGGHAPLVGAHIYLVQPGTTGYGSAVTSILTNSTNNPTYPLTANGSWPAATSGGYTNDQFVPQNGDLAGDTNTTNFNGVTTDLNGQFYISGDYTCQPGPVILIGYGGYPSFVPTSTPGTNTFNVTSFILSNQQGSGATETATYTFTVATTATTPELFYVGESVTINGFSGVSNFTGTATPVANVLSTNLTTTTFALTLLDENGGLATNTTFTTPGITAVATPIFNPAAVNMAVLGNCPPNGTFAPYLSNGQPNPYGIKYVYMNEISTTAAAYAFSPFANWAQNDQYGNDEFHIGGPASSAAALQLAAVTAGNLYDIQGGNVATTPAPQDGDVHIARTVTPSGTGTVPQAQINFIGNILAACVDSNNTYRPNTGVKSTQCQNLGFYASDNGVYDTTNSTTHQAFNIAQAALNMARFPQGAGTGSSTGCNALNYCTTQTVTTAPSAATASAFTTGLYNIVGGNVPFTGASPLASAPNDYAIAIVWSNASANGGTAISHNGIAIDASNNVFTGSPTYNSTGGALKFTPSTGLYSARPGPLSVNLYSIAADSTGTIWMPGASGPEYFAPAAANGGNVATANATKGAGIAVDSNFIYMTTNWDNTYNGTDPGTLVKENNAGASAAGFPLGTGTTGGTQNTTPGCMYYVFDVTTDPAGNIWTDSVDASGYAPGDSICEFNSAGTLIYSYFLSNYNGTVVFPHKMNIDASNNLWFADEHQGLIFKVPAGLTTANNNTGILVNSGGAVASPRAVAVDGANTIWSVNEFAETLGHFTDSNVSMAGTSYAGGASGTGTGYLSNLEVDAGGNVWATGFSGTLWQFVGLATPTITPIAAARAANNLGTKPGLSTAHITAYNIGNAGTNQVQFSTSSGNPAVGETLVLSGFTNSTFFNGQTVLVTGTSSNNTVFLATFVHANVAPTTENGVGSPLN